MFLGSTSKNFFLVFLYLEIVTVIFSNGPGVLKCFPSLLNKKISLPKAEEIREKICPHCGYFVEKTGGYRQNGWINQIGGKTLSILELCNIIT